MGSCCEGPHCRSTGNDQSECHIDIWKAAQDGLYDQARDLVAADPSCVNKPGPVDHVPPLHWAALNGHTELCRLFLNEGAMINQLGGDQWSTALHWAACRGQVGVMALLLQKGADYMALRDQQGYLPIHIAAQHGQTFALLFLIAAARQSIIDCTDLHGRTALIWAAYRGHDEAVKVLLEEGSQISLKDRSGNTALHWATIKGCAQVIKLLLEAGADPFDTDGEGKSSIDYAKEKRWPWFDKILSSAGHSTGPRVASAAVDLESGAMLPAVKSRWLPQRLFRPILDERTLKLLFGRILPPFVIVACLYVAAYAFNPIIGFVLVLTIAFGCRGLFLLLLPSSPPQDPKVPFLNTFHHTIDTAGAIIALTVFLPSKTSSATLCWSVVILDLFVTYLLVKAQTLDPGRVGKPKSDDERRNTVHQLAEKDQLNRRSFCLTCRAAKPMRSKHCKICGICVARFDHHCPWTNNCIGAGNHRAFVAYLVCCFAAAFAFTKASIAYIGSNMVPYEASTINPWIIAKCINAAFWIRSAYSSAPFVFILTYIIGGGAFGVGLLVAFQFMCISRNRTTNENANQWRLEYLRERPAELGDSGVLGNCARFWSGKQNNIWYNLHEACHDEGVTIPQGSSGYNRIPPQDTIVINVVPVKKPEEDRNPPDVPVKNVPEPNISV